MAKLAPRAARRSDVVGSPPTEKLIHSSTIAASVPATGVQSPTSRNIPTTAAITCSAIDARWGVACHAVTAK